MTHRKLAAEATKQVGFPADWLALREPFDARVRSYDLARRFVAMLPPEPRLLDLAAGAGSQFRWLAPLIGGPQHWVFLDNDVLLLRRGLRGTAAWAERLGHRANHDDAWSTLGIDTPRGRWHIETMAADLSEPPSLLPIGDVDTVTCNAWLDLVSADWLEELIDVIARRPFYATMTVDARDGIHPIRRDDLLVWHGYISHQRGDKGFGDASLGAGVARFARELCRWHGLQCASALADWRVDRHQRPMLHALLGYWTRSAREVLPRHATRIDAWERDRRSQIAAAQLAMRIGHRDILISPLGGPRYAAGRNRRRFHRGD